MMRRFARTLAIAALAAAGLAGCSSSGSGGGSVSASSCTNKILQPKAPRVTVWAWYPSFQNVVDLFNQSHSDVQICWTNAGQGNDEYTKFSTAVEAGKGAPDVVMLEDEVLPSFEIRKALVDLAPYGASKLSANYTPGTWSQVTDGSSVYAIPVDGGPMGMLYRKDIFDKYGLTVPTTWDQFAADAALLKSKGFKGEMTDFPANGRSFIQALFAQAGSNPYTFSVSDPQKISIGLDDAASQKVLSYWQNLVSQKLVAADDAFTTDSNTKLVNGTYAVYLAAAWGPGYLTGLTGASKDAEWRAAPLPQWDPAHPVSVNWGGSTFAVTSQAGNKALAAEVAEGIFGTTAAWKIGIEKAALFPLWKPVLDSSSFQDMAYPFFGGQKINQDVFLSAENSYQGFTFSPFQSLAYDKLTAAVTSVVQAKASPAAALSTLQSQVVAYAKQQGFTVTQK